MIKKVLLFAVLFAAVFFFAKSSKVNGAQLTKTSALKGIVNLEKSTFIVQDNNNGGVAATATLSPSTSYIEVSCLDSDNCEIEIDDTVGNAGDIIWLSQPSGGNQYNINFINPPQSLQPGLEDIEFIHDGIGWRIVG